MKEINIAGAIDELMIFDDPEYCSKGSKLCKRFGQYDEDAWCWIFDADDRPNTRLEYDESNNKFKKCDQCKAAYQKAKSIKKERECYVCGKDQKHSIGYCGDHYQEFANKVNESAGSRFNDGYEQ